MATPAAWSTFPALQLVHQHQGWEGAEDVAPDGGVPLVEDGPGHLLGVHADRILLHPQE